MGASSAVVEAEADLVVQIEGGADAAGDVLGGGALPDGDVGRIGAVLESTSVAPITGFTGAFGSLGVTWRQASADVAARVEGAGGAWRRARRRPTRRAWVVGVAGSMSVARRCYAGEKVIPGRRVAPAAAAAPVGCCGCRRARRHGLADVVARCDGACDARLCRRRRRGRFGRATSLTFQTMSKRCRRPRRMPRVCTRRLLRWRLWGSA